MEAKVCCVGHFSFDFSLISVSTLKVSLIYKVNYLFRENTKCVKFDFTARTDCCF